jgi:predicted dehydrogenase
MSDTSPNAVSRRELLKTTGQVAAASVFAASALPGAHAAESNTIQLVLIGCGGRGGGAIANALTTKQGPTKLIAMVDVFPEKLASAYNSVKKSFPDQVDVPEDHKFIGFDGYKQAMDLLKPGDVVILTTPVVFRWVHFSYAISKGLNVFMEKPTTTDGPTSRKMLELAAESVKKNLKVGVGLMCRHCRSRMELAQRIKDGQIGDLTLLRAYRIAGPTGSASVSPKPAGMSELAYQIKNFHGFLWLSGGGFSDFLIHNIDECCWMKDAFPIEAKGHGGRHYRGDQVDQNFDTYNIEYTFADGTKMFMAGRTMPGCHQEFATYVHGTKGSAVVSQSGHHPSKARMYKSHRMVKEDLVWECQKPEANPYDLEWEDLMTAIRKDQPYNECERGAKSSLVTAMGRMACHTGQVITYEDMLNCEHEFAPNADKLTLDGPSPLMADASGKYPVPMPGINARKEY